MSCTVMFNKLISVAQNSFKEMLELCSKPLFEQGLWEKGQVNNLAFTLSIFRLIKLHQVACQKFQKMFLNTAERLILKLA